MANYEHEYDRIRRTIEREYPRRPRLFGPAKPILDVLDEARKHVLVPSTSHLTLALGYSLTRGPRVYIYNDYHTGRLKVDDFPNGGTFPSTSQYAIKQVFQALNSED